MTYSMTFLIFFIPSLTLYLIYLTKLIYLTYFTSLTYLAYFIYLT